MRARISLASLHAGTEDFEVDVDPEATIARVTDHGALLVSLGDDHTAILAAGEWQRVDITRLEPLTEGPVRQCSCPKRMVGGRMRQWHWPGCPNA